MPALPGAGISVSVNDITTVPGPNGNALMNNESAGTLSCLKVTALPALPVRGEWWWRSLRVWGGKEPRQRFRNRFPQSDFR